MQTKTKKRISYKAKTLARSASSYAGMFKVLQLVARAEPNGVGEYEVSSVIANNTALQIVAQSGKI
jgi:hypothetical protein